APLRHGDDVIAETGLGKLDRGPVEVAGKLVGNLNALGRSRGRLKRRRIAAGAFVLEVDSIWDGHVSSDECQRSKAGRTPLLVGVARGSSATAAAAAWAARRCRRWRRRWWRTTRRGSTTRRCRGSRIWGGNEISIVRITLERTWIGSPTEAVSTPLFHSDTV